MDVEYKYNTHIFTDSIAHWIGHTLHYGQGDRIDKLIRLVTMLTAAHLEQHPDQVQVVADCIDCQYSDHRIIDEVE